MPVTIGKNDVLSKKLFLTKTTYEIKGVSISAENQENKTETKHR